MRITILNFRDHVTPHQLKKGKEYFDRQKVLSLETSPEGLWEAEVMGRELYTVEISLKGDDDEIRNVVCECIAHTDNPYCKHVIAAILAIEDELYEEDEDEEDDEKEEEEEGDSITKEEQLSAALARQDYYYAIEIAKPYIAWMPRPSELKRGTYGVKLAEMGFQMLVRISREALPANVQESIYQLALKSVMKEQYCLTALSTHWIDVLIALKGTENDVLPILDKLLKLERYQPHIAVISGLSNRKMQLLRKLGREDEAQEVLNEYPDSKEIRDLLIQEAVARNDYNEAKRLAEEGIQKDGFTIHDQNRIHFERQLYTLAQQFNDVDIIRKSAVAYFLETREMEYYQLVKKTFAPEDWLAAADQLIIAPMEKKINDKPSTSYYLRNRLSPMEALALIHTEEQALPRLLQLLQLKPLQSLIEKYTDLLVPLYPKEMVGLYYGMLLEYAATNKHADAILWLCSTMNKMKEWESGKTVVATLVEELIAKYPTRPKMHEALRQV